MWDEISCVDGIGYAIKEEWLTNWRDEREDGSNERKTEEKKDVGKVFIKPK